MARPSSELDEAKSYLKGSQMLALDTSSKLASALLQYQLDKLPIDYIEKRNAIVDAVTLDDAKQRRQAAVGPRPAHRDRRPRPASRRPAGGRDPAHGELSAFRLAHPARRCDAGDGANPAQNRHLAASRYRPDIVRFIIPVR